MCCECHDSSTTCIHAVPIFSSLKGEEIGALQEITHSCKYEKGDFIFREGEPSRSLFVVHEGLIKISKVSDEGKEQIIRLMFPGDFFGQAALLENKTHYAYAEVLEPTNVCRIDRDDFIPFLESHPELTMRFMLALSERLSEVDEWMGALGLLEAESRIAKALIMLQQRNGIDQIQFDLPLSKKDLASLIGTTPETLSRKLDQFKSRKILDLSGRKGIRILNLTELKKMAGYSI
ncbi:MAG TPA: Crp/Fnr family transcriptional regulator [Bacillota bacterium]|nr:Crp/Fnr family transcriptional regulator [Bacillota bacterium]